ncbi:MAG: transposase [Calditrichia bacterium]|nr:transposase [Calditrichia bacterium]
MRYHRRSIRLKNHDYTQSGMYYVTICVKHEFNLFGNIKNGQMMLNQFGQIARSEWLKTHTMRKNIAINKFVIMPDHIHGILIIKYKCRGTMHRALTYEKFGKPVSNSIPTIIRYYKAVVTKRINILRNTPGAQIWQRNYYEHIIRNKQEYYAIRQYIIDNSKNWK